MTADEIAEVFELRQRLWRCGYRPIAVWNPDQLVNDKGEPLNNPGKQPRGRWGEDASHNPPEAVRTAPDPRALNTGLLCGDIIGFDIDVLDQALVDQIVELIEDRAGPTPLKRIGRAPKILLVYRPDHRFTKIKTPELFFPDESKAQVELLADGQQFVASGIHPETGRPFCWLDGSPADVPLELLPIVSQADARALVDLAEQLLRAAGAREKEKPERAHPRPNGGAGNFFAQVNSAALADIPAWARLLFPHTRFEPGTGAWRVSSKDLGRNLEEDISIHPDGIRDFGEEAPLSAIDLAIRYGTGTATAVEAALWLCDRLGIQPSSFGFRRQTQPDAAVSFMITRMQKELLAGLGYTAEQIREMTPADGHLILKERGILPEIPQPTPAGGNGHDPQPPPEFDANAPPPDRARRQSETTDEATPKSIPDLAQLLDIHSWATLDVPPEPKLLGDLITPSTRGFLVGHTGLGKTLMSHAMAAGMASANGFLHWRSERPSRWVIIDGEMPTALIKARSLDLIRRAGDIPAGNLMIYSLDRAEEIAAALPGLGMMTPLNTEDGQRFVMRLVDMLKAEGVIFDNVMSLVEGDQKDEIPWSDTLPPVSQLTRQKVAQLWLDHTGHNQNRQYGTATKGWRMDTIGLMIPLADEDRHHGEVAFRLSFEPPGKCRRRTPENWDDFETCTIRLDLDRWTVEPSTQPPKIEKLSPQAKDWYRALLNALCVESARPNETTRAAWLAEAITLDLVHPTNKDRQGSVMRKYIGILRTARLIDTKGEIIIYLAQKG
jgi:hypothetical protein